MSAFISVRFPHAIHLFADGAVYDDDGVVLSFVTKISTSTTVPVAITARGSEGALVLAGVLCEMADQRGIDALLDTLRRVETDLSARRFFKEVDGTGFDLAIAVWHQETGPAHYRIHSYAAMPNVAPFKLHPLDDLVACGAAFDPQILFASGLLPVIGDTTAWARTKGGQIMDMMRGMKGGKLPGSAKTSEYVIGGHVDLATVTASGVKVERIRRYKDKVGQRIKPEGAENPLQWAGMSRKQRRALEREARQRVA